MFRSEGGARPAPDAAWRPLADIYRTDRGWLIKFELAGVPAEDILISASGRFLTVAGIRRDLTEDQVRSHHLMEIPYNRFERTVELPCDVESSHLDIQLRNGILTVRVSTEGEAE